MGKLRTEWEHQFQRPERNLKTVNPRSRKVIVIKLV